MFKPWKPVKVNCGCKMETSLKDEFRKERGQTEEKPKPTKEKPKKGKPPVSKPYEIFLHKYERLEETMDSFTPTDLAFYFREKSIEYGFKYYIANMKKETAIMKRALQNFTSREVCMMIEFLYASNQDYLNKFRLSPNLLVSGWNNKIYYDTQLWLEDKYSPEEKPNKKPKLRKTREWSEKLPEDKKAQTTIGEWD